MLSQIEMTEREAMIAEAIELELAKFSSYDGDTHARLLQCRSDIRKYDHTIKVALLAGEPENSDYIDNLIEKLHTAIGQEAQLNALAGI